MTGEQLKEDARHALRMWAAGTAILALGFLVLWVATDSLTAIAVALIVFGNNRAVRGNNIVRDIAELLNIHKVGG